jgi:ElaB/YqjD/DUF883 family membrane-anchored ribosome-binding protein
VLQNDNIEKDLLEEHMGYTAGSISELRKQMEELGVKEGGFLRPDSASDSPDLNEIKVVLQAKQFGEAEESDRTDSFVDAEKKISDIDQKIEAIEAACNSNLEHDLLEGAFHSALSKEEHSLVTACARELEARAALNSFKTRNQISDPAHYPPDQLFHFAFLIMFVVIETVVNAFFYQGSSGLLGGAVVALSVSVVNMSLAAALGSMYRYVNLPDLKEKITGYAGLIAFIVLALVLNLIFSTFRVQYELLQQQVIQENLADPTTAMLVAAFRTAVSDAFRVFVLEFPEIDVMSFVLFFVGAICSCLAFWKGYSHDDKHPGYGEMDRRHKATELAFTNAKDQAFNAAVDKVHQIANEVDELRTSLIASQRNSHALKAQVQGAQSIFDGNVRKIQGELNLVIEAYRGANKATRSTPAPKYFEQQSNITPEVNNERIENLLESIDKLSTKSKTVADEKVTLLGNKLQQIRSRIHQLVQDEFQRYMETIRQSATASLRAHGQVQNAGY